MGDGEGGGGQGGTDIYVHNFAWGMGGGRGLGVALCVKDWLLVPNGPKAVLEYSSVPVRVLSLQAIKRDRSSTWRAINTLTKCLSPLNGNFLSEPALDVFNVHFM